MINSGKWDLGAGCYEKRDHVFDLHFSVTHTDLFKERLSNGLWSRVNNNQWVDQRMFRHTAVRVSFVDGSYTWYDNGWCGAHDHEFDECEIPEYASNSDCGIKAFVPRLVCLPASMDFTMYQKIFLSGWAYGYIDNDLLWGSD